MTVSVDKNIQYIIAGLAAVIALETTGLTFFASGAYNKIQQRLDAHDTKLDDHNNRITQNKDQIDFMKGEVVTLQQYKQWK